MQQNVRRRSFSNMLKRSFKLLIRDIKDAKWAILFVIAYFVLLRKVLYSICPMVIFTGYPCPACGLTRAGVQVLRFHFVQAWRIHPFIYPIIGLAIAFCVERYILFRKKYTGLRWCTIVLIAGMLVFYIWRMYKFFPGEPPMSYYRYNMLSRLIGLLHLYH